MKIFSFLLVFLISFFLTFFTYAQEYISKKITKNNTVLVDFTVQKSLKNLYLSKDFTLTLTPNSDAQVLLHNNTLVLHFSGFEYTGKKELIINQKGIIQTLELDINIVKNPLYFDIKEDILSLSLQDKSLSCESSAAADIAEHLLTQPLSEDDIIEVLPKSWYNTLPQKNKKFSLWGDPEIGFVGYIDTINNLPASQKKMTGYGVYEQPIASALNSYGLRTSVINKTSHSKEFTPEDHLSFLLSQLQKGSLVELWGDWCTRSQYEDGTESQDTLTEKQASLYLRAKNGCYDVNESRILTWYYPLKNGTLQKIQGLAGEHTFILLGWVGDRDNPTHIIVWDTDTGYHKYPLVEWMRKWSKIQYRSLVVSK